MNREQEREAREHMKGRMQNCLELSPNFWKGQGIVSMPRIKFLDRVAMHFPTSGLRSIFAKSRPVYSDAPRDYFDKCDYSAFASGKERVPTYHGEYLKKEDGNVDMGFKGKVIPTRRVVYELNFKNLDEMIDPIRLVEAALRDIN